MSSGGTRPHRTCIGCGRTTDTEDLVRFVRQGTTGSEASVVHGRTLDGRGAWLCASTLEACAATALRRRAFERALRGPISPESVADAVRAAARSVRRSEQNARG